MTAEERSVILSNDYIDLIIDYNRNQNIFNRYPNAIPHIMNDKYAILYLPENQLKESTFRRYRYSILPACYGINAQSSLEASGISKLRRLPNFDLKGQGVLVGIVDTGIDYAHPAFRKGDGSSRIVSIWDQTIESENYPSPFYYGTQYSREDINRALGSQDPLQVVPSIDSVGHGTMLAGILAGSEAPSHSFSGILTESELVVVKLKQAKQGIRDFYVIPSNAVCYQENDIMWGIRYLVDMARQLKRPIAICVGLGSAQGSHDGRGALSNLLTIAADFPGVAIAVAGGNEGNARRHYYSIVERAVASQTVELNIGNNEPGFCMEIWGTAPNTYSIDITTPSGEYVPRIAESLRVNRDLSFLFEKTVITVDYQVVESAAGDELIFLRFQNPSAGIWRFRVYSRGDLQGSFHIWLPMGGFITDDTNFVEANANTTITSPGNSTIPLTLTAYNVDNNTLYRQAGKGYSRIGVIKPELAAPGVDLLAPLPGNRYTNASGTGVAAAHGAGVMGMILEWAIVRGNYPGVDTVEIKKFLIRGARRNPNLVFPNPDWGYGILDIYNVFDTLRGSV